MHGGGSHAFSIAGGRTGVLLLHGLCGSPTEMRFVANGLARAGYSVHCPQLAGHCAGEADLVATTWQDWVTSAERGLDVLSGSCDRIVVGGLSTGAVIALLLASRFPARIQGLALYSPTLWLDGRCIPWFAHLFRLVTFRRFANLFRFPAPLEFGIKDDRLRTFIKSALAAPGAPALPFSTPGVAVLERRRLVNRALNVLGEIHQPVLMLHPRDDDYASLANTFHLQARLPGRVELVVLEDSYHLITIDRQRQTVLDHTLNFVGRISGTAEPRCVSSAARA